LRAALALTLVTGALLAVGQPAQDLLVNMRRAHQQESSVYLKRNTILRVQHAPNGTIAFRESVEEELVLKDLSGSAREQEVHYSSLMPLEKLEAYTLSLQGKGYKRVNVDHFDHRDRRDDQTFHDDQRVASFLLPSLTAGSIGHVAYTVSYIDGRFATGHFFGESYPTEESSLTVISDPGIDVDVRTFHLPDSLLTRTETMEKGRRVQRLTMHKVPAMQFEANAPSPRYYSPHAQLVVHVPGENGALSGTERLYQWYSSMITEAVKDVPASIQALSDSIVAGVSAPEQRAALIYRWMQEHVRYIAFEDGMNGFIPAQPAEVCRVRYGDCKGMSGLLRALLQAAGLDAHMAWIGTRSIPYTYDELPSAAATNHMIVALDIGDTTLFLDPTSQTSGFGVPSGFIQGKEALIAVDPEHHRVVEVPVMPASFSTVLDSIHGRLEGTSLVGTGVVSYTGYERYRLAEYLRATPVAKRSERMRSVLMKGSNAFQLDTCTITGLEDRDAPLVVRYAFRIPDLGIRSGTKLFVPINLTDPWEHLRVHEDRKLPIELDHRISERYVVDLELPPGVVCTGIPAPYTAHTPDLDLRMTVTDHGTSVRSDATFTLNTLMLDEGLSDWRATNTKLMKELGRALVLETR
jgi:hypothetical protein